MKISLVTHGPLAEALKESSKMFFSEKSEVLNAIGLYPKNTPDELLDQLKEIVEEDLDQEYLFLVDIFAGTPFNMVALLIEEYPDVNIQCITGVNMPLLLETMANYELSTLDELLEILENIGEESIINLRKSLEI